MPLVDVRALATLRSKIRVQTAAPPLTGKFQILDEDLDLIINGAVLDYSADEPRQILLDLTEAALTDVSGVKMYLLDSWDFDISSESEIEIEFPIDQAIKTILRRGADLDFEIVERPTGVGGAIQKFVKFFTEPKDTAGNWRIRYFTRWPDTTEDAALSVFGRRQDEMVGLLSAVYTARFLASHFSHTDDPTLAIDSVAYRTKAQEWQTLSKTLWEEYVSRIERPKEVKRAGQDAEIVDLDLSFRRSNKFGRGYLVHGRRRR